MRNWILVLTLLIAATCCLGAAKKPARKAVPKPAAKSTPAVIKPIPLPANSTHTQAEFDKRLAQFVDRITVEAYGEIGTRDPKWDDAAIKFIKAVNVEKLSTPADDEALKVCEQGKSLMDQGCNDPLVVSCYGIAEFYVERYAESEGVLRKVLPEFAKSRYHKYCARIAASYVVHDRVYQGKPQQEIVEACKQEMDLLGQSLVDGSYGPKDQSIALLQLKPEERTSATGGIYEPLWKPMLNAKQPGIDPYVYKVALGRWLVNSGWRTRGTGWASDVSDEAWQVFEKNLKQADKLFREAYKLRPGLPEAPAEMVRITLAGYSSGTETARNWFDRAVAAQLDFVYAYDYFTWSLMPRWGGTPEEMYAFGLECAKTRRFDTSVPGWMWTALAQMGIDFQVDTTSIWKDPRTIEWVTTVCDEYTKTRPQQAELWQSRKAAADWKTQRYEDAYKILGNLTYKIHTDPFAQVDSTDPIIILNKIRVYGGPAGKQFVEADKLRKARKFEEARAIYEKLTKNPTGDPAADGFVNHELETLKTDISLSKDGWVDLTPNNGFSAWRQIGTGWSLDEDGTIVAKPDRVPFTITYDYTFRPGVEVEAEFEPIPGGASDALAAGIAIRRARSTSTFNITLSKKDGKLAMQGSGIRDVSTPIKNLQARNTINVKIGIQQATVSVNGKTVADEYLTFASTDLIVGLCCTNSVSEGGVKIRGFRLRQIGSGRD